MSTEKRTYRMGRRAELEAQTRRRIARSALELHGTVGPARTSISAIAERAGVRRSTVYRHFPDERALFAACSAEWEAENPVPDLAAWAAVEDPQARLARGLDELYAFYGRTQQMLDNLIRDETAVESVRETFAAFREYLDAARDVLLGGRRQRGRRRARVAAALGHAIAFPTWRSLVVEQGLERRDAVDLMCRLVAAAGEDRGRGPAPEATRTRRPTARVSP
jgi:AcrR family transcriptional regulator